MEVRLFIKPSSALSSDIQVNIRSVCSTVSVRYRVFDYTHGQINPLNVELNPICYLLALLGAHHFLHVSRIRVNGAWGDSSMPADIYLQSYVLQTKATWNANEQNGTTVSRVTVCSFKYELAHRYCVSHCFQSLMGR